MGNIKGIRYSRRRVQTGTIQSRHRQQQGRVYVGKTAKAILGALLVTGALVTIAVVPGLLMALGLINKRHNPRRTAYTKSLQQLVRAGYLVKKGTGGQASLVLTHEGRQFLEVQTITLPKPAVWDKRWRLMVFDIPESKRDARRALHDLFHDLGVYQLQRSVYCYPYACEAEMRSVGIHFDVVQHILYFETTTFGHTTDTALRTYFKLRA